MLRVVVVEKSDGVVAICFDLSFVDSAFVGVFTSAIFDFLRMALVFAIVVSILWVNNCRDARVGSVIAPPICFFSYLPFSPPKSHYCPCPRRLLVARPGVRGIFFPPIFVVESHLSM